MGSYEYPKYKKAMKSFNKLFKGSRRRSSLSSSLNRMAKGAVRHAERQRKFLQKEFKEKQKLMEKQAAALEVQIFENQLEVLTSIHKETPVVWNWDEISNKPPPVKPAEIHNNEEKARNAYNNYVPSWIDRIFFRVKSKMKSLEKNIEVAIKQDDEINKNAFEDYNNSYNEWEVLSEIGKKILNDDLDGFYETISIVDPFNDICDIGSSFEFTVIDKNNMEVVFSVNSDEIIPSEKKTLTKTGKLSVKNMAKKDYYDIYQDYVCGSVLRIGRELFALLPVNLIIITAITSLFNSSIGHNEEKPILSVALTREVFSKLDFERLDPSDSMINFKYNMNFKKTTGFAPVKALEIAEFLI